MSWSEHITTKKGRSTAKQEAKRQRKQFVKKFLIDLNATQAAIRAGYKRKGACAIGQRNLTKPHIQEENQKKEISVDPYH